jgi:hypothetical protein
VQQQQAALNSCSRCALICSCWWSIDFNLRWWFHDKEKRIHATLGSQEISLIPRGPKLLTKRHWIKIWSGNYKLDFIQEISPSKIGQ